MTTLTVEQIKRHLREAIQSYQQDQEAALATIREAENASEVLSAAIRLSSYEQMETTLVQIVDWIESHERYRQSLESGRT